MIIIERQESRYQLRKDRAIIKQIYIQKNVMLCGYEFIVLQKV